MLFLALMQSNSMSPKPLNDISILLVEDNEMNTLLASVILQRTGAKVTEADNGMTAIQLLSHRYFDLVLMDLHLPLMDGFETTRYIRRNLCLQVPVLAMTASLTHEQEAKCMDAGMNGFISKPYTAEAFLCAISKYISGKHQSAEKRTKPDVLSNYPLYDLTLLENASNGSRSVLQQMVLVFVDKVTLAVSELKAAYQTGNFPRMYDIAHHIKPTIDSLNIVSINEIIRQIECYAEKREQDSTLKDMIENLDDSVSKVVQQLRLNILLH